VFCSQTGLGSDNFCFIVCLLTLGIHADVLISSESPVLSPHGMDKHRTCHMGMIAKVLLMQMRHQR
jgi:hypothetical protein